MAKLAWIVSALIVACGAAENMPAGSIGAVCQWPDGSNACDGAPVMAEQLEGAWCQDRYTGTDASHSFCLTLWKAYNLDGSRVADGRMRYVKTSARCTEEGHATGGLEFWPEQSNCNGTELHMYSVSVDWTGDYSMAMFFDDRHVERYWFQGD